MKIDIITAFPGMITAPLNESIIKRAIKKNLVKIQTNNLRQWAKDKHKTVDDAPYGGGAGMVYKVEPLYKCISDIVKNSSPDQYNILLTSPRGKVFNQKKAVQLSMLEHVVIICGHYKGVDERIKSFFPIQEVSVGDYVLSGGEFAALVIIDAIVRLIPGVLNDVESAWTDSFSESLLDCDYYTRPAVFKEKEVPAVLLSGSHEEIKGWRQKCKEKITKKNRPDLYKKYVKEIKVR